MGNSDHMTPDEISELLRTHGRSPAPWGIPRRTATPLRMRRRWWMQPVCWLKRGHARRGTPMVVEHIEHAGQHASHVHTSVVMSQACERCGKGKAYVGVDPATPWLTPARWDDMRSDVVEQDFRRYHLNDWPQHDPRV